MTTESLYAAPRKQFERETSEHQTTVLHDDGLYRHLRFAKPGTRIWSFDIVTWPGHLSIAGDIGDGWTFSREPDMIRFFTPATKLDINPGYWWEKLPQQLRKAAKVFDDEALRKHAHEAIDEWCIDLEDGAEVAAERARAVAAFDEGWEWTTADYPHQAEYVRDFEFEDSSGRTHRFYDTWEWDSEGWDHHYLLACFAIAYGVEKYTASRKVAEAGR